MTKEEMAALLDGSEYPMEMDSHEEKAAKQARLLVVFGASDDLCELRGVIRDEVGCYGSGGFRVSRDGKLLVTPDRDESEVLAKFGLLGTLMDQHTAAISVEACWCAEKGGPSWTYRTTEPHATFNVMEDGEVYCRGIVIQL
jgi:hypothetical protein